MYEHFIIDTNPKGSVDDGKARDDDYDKEYEKREDGTSEDDKDRLPIQDHEHYEDPDFDAEWNNTEEPVSDTNFVGENPLESGVENVAPPRHHHDDFPTEEHIDNEWEEV